MKTNAPSDVLKVLSTDNTHSQVVVIDGFERGSLGAFPTATVTGNITYEVSNELDSSGDPTNFQALQDATGAAVTAISGVAADDIFPINSNVFAHRYMRLLFAAAQTGATAGNPLEIPIFLAAND